MRGLALGFRKIGVGLFGLLAVAGGVIFLPGPAQALIINNDLIGHDYSGGGGPNGTATNGTSTTINSAIFTVANDNTGTGTGNFNPFLRTHGNPKDYEVGFNTDGNFDTSLYDMIPDSNWTHSLTLGDLTVETVDSVDYVRFVLDLGEPSGLEKPIISLRGLQLWVNDTTGSDIDYTDGLGTKIWDIDGLTDTTLNLDYDILSGGNGKYDLIALFPTTLFTGYDASDFLYLYNEFGLFPDEVSPPTYPSEGTFEEWSAVGEGGFDPPDDPDPPEVPVPAPLGLILFGLALLRASRKV